MKRVAGFNTLMAAVFLSFLIPLHAQNDAGLTARDYFNELIAAGRLTDMAKSHACFQDDPKSDSFFLIGQSKHMRDSMQANGTFNKLPKTTQDLMKKDFLVVRGYPRGVPWPGQQFLDKDQGSWVSDPRMLDEDTPIRIRFNVNWQTLRYKYAVELLNMDLSYRSESASYGQCEELPTEAH